MMNFHSDGVRRRQTPSDVESTSCFSWNSICGRCGLLIIYIYIYTRAYPFGLLPLDSEQSDGTRYYYFAMDSENGHAEGQNQTASAKVLPRRYSLVTSIVVGLSMVGVGLGVGIGIGAGIWKDSSGTTASPGGDWFFAQQADGARIIRATNDSDIVSVTLEGVQDQAVASNVGAPTHSMGMLPTAGLVSTLNADPGKNAMLVCNEGENKLATPITLNYGEADGDAVTYFARLVPFNNGTWSRMDEGRALNASSTLSSFAAGDLVQFNSSCFLFIDGFSDFAASVRDTLLDNPKSAILGAVNAPVTLLVKGAQYVAGDEQRKEEVKKEALAAVEGSFLGVVAKPLLFE